MTKVYILMATFALSTLIIISFSNIDYNGYQPLAAHYINNDTWSDEKCSSCHFSIYDEVVNSYHVQLVNSYGANGQWDPLFLNLIEKRDTGKIIIGCSLCHIQGICPHKPAVAAVATQSECSRCHLQDDLIFKIHDADGITGGSITTNCLTCHSGDTSTENLYFTHIADTTCANKCHQTGVATRAVMWSSDNYGSYDVHSNAGIGCIQCHITSNHQIGRGNIIDRSDSSVAADQLVRQCKDCHTEVTHGMIVDAHLEKVSCEACHIPVLPGGMLPGGKPVYSIDWTKGHRDITFKEKDFQPVLAWFNGTVQGIPYPSERDDPGAVLKPFNVISITWWDEGNDMDIVNNPNSSLQWGSPVVLSHIDVNGKSDYPNAVLRNRQFYYSVSHNIVSKKSALGKSALWCADCHGNTSRIDWKLLGYEADPAQTDPPTDFTSYKITVEIIPARPKPLEVESKQFLFKPFRGGD